MALQIYNHINDHWQSLCSRNQRNQTVMIVTIDMHWLHVAQNVKELYLSCNNEVWESISWKSAYNPSGSQQ